MEALMHLLMSLPLAQIRSVNAAFWKDLARSSIGRLPLGIWKVNLLTGNNRGCWVLGQLMGFMQLWRDPPHELRVEVICKVKISWKLTKQGQTGGLDQEVQSARPPREPGQHLHSAPGTSLHGCGLSVRGNPPYPSHSRCNSSIWSGTSQPSFQDLCRQKQWYNIQLLTSSGLTNRDGDQTAWLQHCNKGAKLQRCANYKPINLWALKLTTWFRPW